MAIFTKCRFRPNVLDLSQHAHNRRMFEVLKEVTGQDHLPQVFIRSEFVGDDVDLQKLKDETEEYTPFCMFLAQKDEL